VRDWRRCVPGPGLPGGWPSGDFDIRAVSGPLVMVIDRFPERSQTFVVNEIVQLRKLGVDLQVFDLEEPLDRADEMMGIHVQRVARSETISRRRLAFMLTRLVPRWGVGPLRATRLLQENRDDTNRIAFRRAVDLVRRLKARPAAIHAHFANAPASVAMFASAMTGVPFSFTAHAYDIFEQATDLRRKLQRAAVAIDVCEYNRDWLQARHQLGTRHVVVPCGVDLADWRRSRPYRHTPFRVLAVGRLVEKKGFSDLVRAIGLLRDRGVQLRLDVIGTGADGSALLELVAILGLEDWVSFHGSRPSAVVREAMEDASVFCLPCVVASDGDRDSQPVVVKEAMAMELPVVGTKEVGMPEMVVHGETGLLVPPHDPGALAGALQTLADDAGRCQTMGAAGRRRVEAFFGFDTTIPMLLEALSLAGARPS